MLLSHEFCHLISLLEYIIEDAILLRAKTSLLLSPFLHLLKLRHYLLELHLFLKFALSLLLNGQAMNDLTLYHLLVTCYCLLELLCLSLLVLLLSLELFLEPPPCAVHSPCHAVIVLNAVGVIRSKVRPIRGRRN